MPDLRVEPEAEDDIQVACDWYEEQRPGLAEAFEFELHHAFERIREMPNAYPEVRRGARRHLMRRFPYAVYYRLRDDEVRVIAVVHTARAPGVWQGRARQ